MAVDYDVVDEVAGTVAGVYREAELALTRMLARRLGAGLHDETGWAVRKLGEVRAVRRAAQLIADQLATQGTARLREAVAAGYRVGNAAAVLDLAEAHVGDVGHIARGADMRAGNAIQALADAAVRELRGVHAAILPAVEGAYRQAIAGATARRLAGAADLRHAAQAAWAALLAQGVTRFTDSAGRRWRLSTYVEMATRTAVGRAAVVGQTDACLAAGITDVYVVDNPRECPICAPWEAQVLSLTDTVTAPAIATLHAAQRAGLHHPNCRHGVRSYVRGRTRIQRARNPEGPGGYVAEQQQRYLERQIRRWAEREAGAFTDSERRHAAGTALRWRSALAVHLAQHPRLARKSYREQIDAGFAAPASRAGDRAQLTRAT